MRRMDPKGLRLLAACAVLAVGGCGFLVGAAAGGAAYAYASGEGKKAFAEPLPKARAAVLGALADLRLPVLHKDITASSAKVKSTTTDGKDIVIDLSREGETVTIISVRVGVFGAPKLTRLIFDKIEDRLKVM